VDDGLLSIDASSAVAAARDLGKAVQALGREDRRANRVVAAQVADWVQAAARGGLPQQRHFAPAIQPRSTQKVARLAIVRAGYKQPNAGADGTFWGALQYRRFQPWVGNQYTSPNSGPYVITPTVAARQAEIAELYADARMRALAVAFPEGGTT